MRGIMGVMGGIKANGFYHPTLSNEGELKLAHRTYSAQKEGEYRSYRSYRSY